MTATREMPIKEQTQLKINNIIFSISYQNHVEKGQNSEIDNVPRIFPIK